jgi:hypothetical protein
LRLLVPHRDAVDHVDDVELERDHDLGIDPIDHHHDRLRR